MNNTQPAQEAPKTPTKQAPAKLQTVIPRERLVHQVQRNAFLDWLIVLIASCSLALVLVGVGVSVYLGTGERLSAPATNSLSGSRSPLDIAKLQKTLSEFDARAAERDSLIRSYGAPRDPSLP